MLIILRNIFIAINIFMLFFGIYYVVLAFFSLFKQNEYRQHDPKNRIAVVIAARNESQVIGNLLDTLNEQDYPKELLDIYVIPNNCTDNTQEIAENKGALIYECKRVIKSKGDAMNEFFDYILEENDIYDAFCVFDADNLVKDDFIKEMNNALCEGVKIGQGYRDSKNPKDTYISGDYSIYYYTVNRFYNRCRDNLGLSAMINGSGFMVSRKMIELTDGWNTKTLTEDIEYTTKCILKGEKVRWINKAVIYDEQPLTFAQSWKQRKRWTTGLIQVSELHLKETFKTFFKTGNLSCFDIFMFQTAPYMQIWSTFSFAVIAIWLINDAAEIAFLAKFAPLEIMLMLFGIGYLATIIFGIIIALLEKKSVSTLSKGIATFSWFLTSWVPINIMCIFKKETEWHQIEHTRAVDMSELVETKR